MKMQINTFCTIFPNYYDIHFFKDPGQIPFRFSKLGYNATLVCYGRKEDLTETVKLLKVTTIPDKWFTRRFNLGIIWYLLCNSRRIDILNTFHLEWNSLLFSFIYKIFNRKGFSYIKLDNCAFSGTYTWESNYGDSFPGHGSRSLKQKIKSRLARRFMLQKVDLWSVEDDYSKEIFEARHSFFRGKLITVYNGHTSDLQDSLPAPEFQEKEDIILTAGRLGTFQKATEILLESFKKAASGNNYELHLAGPVEKSFEAFLEKFRHENKQLDERIFFHGSLSRHDLQKLYSRSKIFCLPSRYEGMAIVFPEAMFYKNAILTTTNVSLKYLIDRYQAGMAVDRDNSESLSEALLELINNSEMRENLGQRAHEISITHLNWDNIIQMLHEEINARTKLL
jgi:glycosyltransferase involved in cell wall biosynthesis